MAKFNVGDEVRVLEGANSEFKVGEIVRILEDDRSGNIPFYCEDCAGNTEWMGAHEIEVIEPKPKKSARITALESQVAELQAKVEALESAGKYPLTAKFERESTSMDGILADIERKAKPTLEALLATYPTPNQQRADVIKRAKAFVAKYNGIVPGGTTPLTHETGGVRIEFVVNSEKRTVVAIPHLAFVDGIVNYAKGIAKCDPDDVFNADIGKAIALARALGVEVPVEFVKAVQPTEVVVGHIVETPVSDARKVVRIEKWERGDVELWRDNGMYVYADRASILDDTDAVYE